MPLKNFVILFIIFFEEFFNAQQNHRWARKKVTPLFDVRYQQSLNRQRIIPPTDKSLSETFV
jgi:hypothetical protein